MFRKSLVLALAAIALAAPLVLAAEDSYLAAAPQAMSAGGNARTNLFDNACQAGNDTVTKVQNTEGYYIGLADAVARNPDELILLTGFSENPSTEGTEDDKNYQFVLFADPYVVRVTKLDTSGNATAVVVYDNVLLNFTAENADSFMYPGAMAVTADDKLVVVAGTYVYVMDPESGDILAHMEIHIPSAPQQDAAWNSLNILPDGNFLVKSVSRPAGCPTQGVEALATGACEGYGATPVSSMAVIDKDTLEATDTVELDDHITGPVTSGEYDGKDYIYLVGGTKVYRYTYDNGTLTMDDSWGPVEYIPKGSKQTQGSSVAIMGDNVVFSTNSKAANDPVSLVAISQKDGKKVEYTPFKDIEVNKTAPITSWSPTDVTVDPESNMVYLADVVVGRIGAFKLDGSNFTTVWTKKQATGNGLVLLGEPGDRTLVATRAKDLGFQPTMDDIKSYKYETVALRDAETGVLLAETGTFHTQWNAPAALTVQGSSGVAYLSNEETFGVTYNPVDPVACADSYTQTTPTANAGRRLV